MLPTRRQDTSKTPARLWEPAVHDQLFPSSCGDRRLHIDASDRDENIARGSLHIQWRETGGSLMGVEFATAAQRRCQHAVN